MPTRGLSRIHEAIINEAPKVQCLGRISASCNLITLSDNTANSYTRAGIGSSQADEHSLLATYIDRSC